MAQTLATVRSKVRGHIDEPTASYWTDTELNGYIDDRQWDLWRKVQAIRKDYWLSPTGFVLTLVVGQSNYTTTDGVPADIWRISTIRTTQAGFQDVIWTLGNPTSREWVDGLRTDVPIVNPYQIMYALRNLSTIAISPLPQSVLTAQVDYIQQPTVMTADTDTFLLPDPFIQYVQYMAAADALGKGPVGDSVSWQQKGAEAWKSIMETLDTPRVDQGPDLVMGFGENGGNW